MMPRRAWIVLVALAPAWAAPVPAPGSPLKVLFIGNSLTAANDLPAMVEALGKANGQPIVTRTVAYANYSLEDHWVHGDARRTIAEGGWSFVVLQQGPSALPESRVLLVEYARRFAQEARRVHAQVALYMVWPSISRFGDFDGVKASYQAAAKEVGGVFLPAGEAWRAGWRTDSKLAFYGTDGFHPTPLGSCLAALVIFRGLTGKAPARGLPRIATDEQAKLLQDAAAQVLAGR
jgi:hypothetical protein